MEKGADYYSAIYNRGYNTDRYNNIYQYSATQCHGKILDMGCGTQAFKDFVENYDGFDFADIPGVRKGDLYSEDISGYDTYVLLEVLEHVDDLRVLQRIPDGKRVVFSVPTFDDESHLRTYSASKIRKRFAKILDIETIKTFEFREGAHVPKIDGPASIFVVSATKVSTFNDNFTIGAAMIVKNEESCLGGCLESIKGLDDIVILDTGSEDNTEKVASKYNCRYLKDIYTWNDDFAEARNEALKHIETDYLLVIDADEILHGSIDSIRKVIKKNPGELVFNMKCNSKQHSGAYHWNGRVHKRCESVYWVAPIHNYLSVRGSVEIKDASIYYGYSEAHKRDPDRAMRILHKIVVNNPLCRRERFYLAREYYYRKHYTLALHQWEHYLEISRFAGERADAYLFMARCHACLNQNDKAKDMCMQALKINGNFREAWRLLADLSGPINRKRFQDIADTANNEGVVFVRGN